MFVLRYTIVRVKKNALLCARVQPRLTPETNTLATEGIDFTSRICVRYAFMLIP